jgi:hypothetical protein
MTFDKLADRCLLFVDERKQMLIELLKEAELELTRQCNMYEDTRTFTCDGSTSYGLPSNYKQLHDKYWAQWLFNIDQIVNQDADRELIHTIKREV